MSYHAFLKRETDRAREIVANPHTYAPSLVSLSQRVIQQIGRRHGSNRQNNLHAHPRLCGDDELQSLHGE